MGFDPKREKRRKDIIRQLKELVPKVLKQHPAVSKIWIIGSVATPIFFDMNSDVDIVVDGLPKDKYFDLYRFFEHEIGSELDLILMSDIKAKDKAVLNNKVVIYEKTDV